MWDVVDQYGMPCLVMQYLPSTSLSELLRDKGTLAPGKLADFAVLSRDPLHIPVHELSSVQVSMTVVGGTAVHRA